MGGHLGKKSSGSSTVSCVFTDVAHAMRDYYIAVSYLQTSSQSFFDFLCSGAKALAFVTVGYRLLGKPVMPLEIVIWSSSCSCGPNAPRESPSSNPVSGRLTTILSRESISK